MALEVPDKIILPAPLCVPLFMKFPLMVNVFPLSLKLAALFNVKFPEILLLASKATPLVLAIKIFLTLPVNSCDVVNCEEEPSYFNVELLP